MSLRVVFVADFAVIDLVLFNKIVRLRLASVLVMFSPVFGSTDAVALDALSRISAYYEGWLFLNNGSLFYYLRSRLFLNLLLELRVNRIHLFSSFSSRIIITWFFRAGTMFR